MVKKCKLCDDGKTLDKGCECCDCGRMYTEQESCDECKGIYVCDKCKHPDEQNDK